MKKKGSGLESVGAGWARAAKSVGQRLIPGRAMWKNWNTALVPTSAATNSNARKCLLDARWTSLFLVLSILLRMVTSCFFKAVIWWNLISSCAASWSRCGIKQECKEAKISRPMLGTEILLENLSVLFCINVSRALSLSCLLSIAKNILWSWR